MPLFSFIDDCAARDGEMALSQWRGLRLRRWSYARLAATAFQFARELEARKISKGDRVILQAENSPVWVAAFFGCMLRGVVAVPLDRQSTPEFTARVQQQVKAKLLLTGTDEIHGLEPQLPSLRLDELSDVLSHHSTHPFMPEAISADDLLEIIFTSGTTGEPKGVCLTHRNFLANLEPLRQMFQQYRQWERLVHPLRFLNLLPLSHVFGQFMGIFVPQLLGGEVYFFESLNPSEIMKAVRKQRISVIVTFPRLLETLRDKVERDFAARGKSEEFAQAFAAAGGKHFLRRMWTFRKIHRRFGWKCWAFISGGATLERYTEEFWRRLGFAVIQGYGMTETASLISMPDPFSLVQGSIGKALPGQEVKLDEKGEILIRGENIAAGYWSGEGNGKVRPVTGDEGWLHTGDIGEFDAEGNLFFRGRSKEVIATAAGMKIYPDDLEAALDRQPEIKASCIIAVEGSQGPEPLAVLIPRNAQADIAAAVRRANEKLAEHQQMRRWVVWPESEFPRTTTTRKVIRRFVADAVKVKTEAVEGKAKQAEIVKPAAAPSSYVLQQAARISGEAVSQPSASATLATDLKLDSLGRVELLSALEDRYQVELDEAAFTPDTTLGEVEKLIREGAPEVSPYPYPEWTQTFPITWIRSVVYHLLLLPITRIMCPLRVTGLEHLRAVRGPVLFVSNHITAVDPALILSALPHKWRSRVAIAMIGEFLREWRHPPAGTVWWRRLILRVQYALVVALFNVFPLPQESGFRRSFAFAGETVDRGYSLLVFPEGQRTTDGRMNSFMAGTGLLVQKLEVPVIPARIDGLFALKQQQKYFARPGQVRVKFGEPIRFTHDDTPAQITKTLEELVTKL